MSYPRALALVVAALAGSAWLLESAKAQSDFALDRLFLDPSDNTPLYQVLSFDSVTEVANYYGRSSLEDKLAKEFFAGYTGSSANMLFTRYPDLPGRAHLYGGDISNLSVPQLQAIKGTLMITSQGYKFSGSVNLSGVTSFSEAASKITAALNHDLPHEAVTTGSSIAPVSVAFTGSENANVLKVTAVSHGTIQVGSIIEGHGVPPGAQISAQLSGTPGGAGEYTLFLHGLSKTDVPTPVESMTDTYGVLTVGSVSSGRVAAGQQVTGPGVLPDTAIEANLGGSGLGSTWVVNKAQTEGGESMTTTPAPLFVRFQSVRGATENRGFFFIQQSQDFNYTSSSLTYMTGTAAASLGLAQGSPGVFLSTPGLIVLPGTAAAFMNTILATDDQWATFQNISFVSSIIPPGTRLALEDWAQSTDGGLYTYLKGYSSNTPSIADSIPAAEQLFDAGGVVPEPSTWVMSLLGFASLGVARYRLKRSTRLSIHRLEIAASNPHADRLRGPTL
jgi:hypothetical protein